MSLDCDGGTNILRIYLIASAKIRFPLYLSLLKMVDSPIFLRVVAAFLLPGGWRWGHKNKTSGYGQLEMMGGREEPRLAIRPI